MTDPKSPRRRAIRQAPEVRRQDLLTVAISCLARLGPRGATGREICRQAGVSHSLLRHYFKNPENLLLETYQELCEKMLARFVLELEQPDDSPWVTIDRFLAVVFTDEWSSSDIWGAWISFWKLVRTNPDFAQVSEDYNRRLGALLLVAVARLPRRGRLPDADITTILSAVMDGLWLDHCLSPGRLPRERALALCRQTLRQFAPEMVDA